MKAKVVVSSMLSLLFISVNCQARPKGATPAVISTAKSTKSVHEWVDLGLPSGTKWATTNVGANQPYESGWFFLWSETRKNDKLHKASVENKGINDLSKLGVIDGYHNLKPSYDAASANWGSEWRMPTSDEIDELLTLENEWTTINGVEGRQFKGKNGKSLFIPANGSQTTQGVSNVGKFGYILSSNANKDASLVNVLSVGQKSTKNLLGWRTSGYAVRPVRR